MNYMKMLKNHDLKVTPQRLEILEIVYKNAHINIDNLYVILQNKFPSLSLATVYKNINIMRDRLFLSEVKIPNKKNVYEITKKEHSHAVCSKCNIVLDVELDISKILHQAKEISSFNLTKSSLVFNGICPSCMK